MSQTNLRLNEEALPILTKRLQIPQFKNQFALIFLGDTHIGKQCSNDIDCSLMFTRLLQSVLHNQETDKDILTVIHGGDGTHRGGQHLEEFAYLTRQGLQWDMAGADHIPMFMNVGNHEYIHDPGADQYRKFIADPAPLQSIWLNELRWGVFLLNTGMNDRGYLPDNQFSRALDMMSGELEQHQGYQVVIDMHIPPSIGVQSRRLLALKYSYTCRFRQFLSKHPKSVAAVVSHHRHWAKMTADPYKVLGRTRLYMSAFGGHCDCPRFSCLKLSFVRQPSGDWMMKSSLIPLIGHY